MRAMRGVRWCTLLSLVGLGVCGYLTILHVGFLRGELLGGAACTSGILNCHAVTNGSWGAWFGIPLAMWGLLGYATMFSVSLLGWQSDEWAQQTLLLIALLSVVSVLLDVGLLVVMVFVIRYYCLFCLLTYAVNLSLLFVAERSLARGWPATLRAVPGALAQLRPAARQPVVTLFWGMMFLSVIGVAGVHAATQFMSRGTLGSAQPQIRDFVSKQSRVSVHIAGDPAIGAPTAPLQIIEFSDFLCPACQRASRINTVILANHRRDASFIFKHYPLDNTCNDRVPRAVHLGACRVAAAAECVHQQGQFWRFHDLVFQQGHDYRLDRLESDVATLGVDMTRFQSCMASGEGLAAVKRDIADAGGIGVTSTPTYVINGLVVSCGLNPAMFDEFVVAVQEPKR